MLQNNKNDLWALNFLRLANQVIITSGVNIRIEKSYLTSNIWNYGFDSKIDFDTPIYLNEGKKLICVRTKNYLASLNRVKQLINSNPELNNYYYWRLFSEGENISTEQHLTLMKRCQIEDIIEYVKLKENKHTFLIESGPSTIFNYFEYGKEKHNPIKTIYAAVQIGEIQKEFLVYGNDSKIDISPTNLNSSIETKVDFSKKLNLLNGFKKVHEDEEIINDRLWKYFVFHDNK